MSCASRNGFSAPRSEKAQRHMTTKANHNFCASIRPEQDMPDGSAGEGLEVGGSMTTVMPKCGKAAKLKPTLAT